MDIIDVVGNEIQCAILRGKVESLPRIGRIEIDTSASVVPLERQERALNDIENRMSRRPDLGKLLAWPSEARPPAEVVDIDILTKNFDEAKVNALFMALGSDDAIVVQGPPGTGKTTWIAELVFQELKRAPDKKILLSAQTHIAVDNALEQILELRPGTRAIRIGKPENIAESVASCELSNRLIAWGEEVKHNSTRWLETFRAEVEKRIPSVAILEKVRELNHYEVQRTNFIAELEELRQEKEQAGQTGTRTAKSETTFLAKYRELEKIFALAKEKSENLRLEIGVALEDDEVLTASLLVVEDKVSLWLAGLSEELRTEVHKYTRLATLQADWVQRFGTGEEFEEHLLSLADIVAGTCIGIERAFRKDDMELGFGLVVIDEASKATPTETLVPMSRGDRFVFVGDQEQLPPYVEQELLSPMVMARYNLSDSDLRETLFDRLSRQLPTSCRAMLDTQYRMVPEIGGLISHCFYRDELKTGRPTSTKLWLNQFLVRPVVWFSTSALEYKSETRDGNSFRNLEECRRIKEWMCSLDDVAKSNDTRLTVGVISGYSAQVELLREELGDAVSNSLSSEAQWQFLDVSIHTVDTIQGREVDIVVYSVTRSNTLGSIGHLSSHQRLNVALSRGKEGLILFGDIEHCYAARDPKKTFKEIIDYIRANPQTCMEALL